MYRLEKNQFGVIKKGSWKILKKKFPKQNLYELYWIRGTFMGYKLYNK